MHNNKNLFQRNNNIVVLVPNKILAPEESLVDMLCDYFGARVRKGAATSHVDAKTTATLIPLKRGPAIQSSDIAEACARRINLRLCFMEQSPARLKKTVFSLLPSEQPLTVFEAVIL